MDTPLANEFLDVFTELNSFIETCNAQARSEGLALIPTQTIRIVGQTALLLTPLPFSVASSMDLDVISTLDYTVSKKLEALLVEKGLQLEKDGHLIWMPSQTEYDTLFKLPYVEVEKAKPEFVVASKFKFKRPKDQKLIKDYLESFPDKKDVIKKLAGI
ncbi:hypothetical protein K1X76_09145 [bacterium]|nr:hypothetical protein [bacterium]